MLKEFQQDLIGNNLANEYAKHLLKEKENPTMLKTLANQFNYIGDFKVSTFSVYVDVSNDNGSKKGRYMDYINEFVDAHATLVEFAEDRDNMLSTTFNTVSIGVAFDEEKVVVVDLFCTREAAIESCSINEEMGSVIVKGHMLNDTYGVYAMRIASVNNINKSLMLINPSNMISPEQKSRPFSASFSNAINLLKDSTPKVVDVFVRERPNLIKYDMPFTENMNKFEQDLKFLTLAYRFYLENFPNEYIFREQKKDEDEERARLQVEENKKLEEKRKEKEEKEYRSRKMENEGYGKDFYNIAEVPDDEDEESDSGEGNKESRFGMKKGETINNSRRNMTDSFSNTISSHNSTIKSEENVSRENYQKQLERLEQNIDELKRENEEFQRKIRIIYDFRKKEGRDERNYYKESNINESTYADSLTSAANLHNELNTHKKKLLADLEKYNQSIEIQEERKREVYKILMNYKEELLSNAEYRKGTKIPRNQIEKWLEREKDFEEEIRKLRIENIKNTLELNRLNKELKKMEEYFEGLHLIDFEQLKIENNTLTEKIEDRNEEIHKLKNKINSNVQILAHLQEKYSYVNKEYKSKKHDEDKLRDKLIGKKDKLNEVKKNNEKNTFKKLQSRQKIDQVNSSNLKKYYAQTNSNIELLSTKIDQVLNELRMYRDNGNIKDISLLEDRKAELMVNFEMNLKNLKDNQQG